MQAVQLPSGVNGGGTYTQTYRGDGLRHSQTLPGTRGNGVQVSLWDEASGGNLSPLSWKGRVGTGASLLATDATTQGSWHNVYGGDGFVIADGGTSLPGASNLPRYAQVSFGTAANELWQASTSDVRGLQKPNALTDRIAAAYRLNPVVLDLNLLDERPHIVSLYLLDWNNLNRSGTLTITDATTNATLYTQNVSGYGSGLWLRFRVSGHVKVTLQNTGDITGMGGAVISGVFFDPIPEATSANGSTDLLAQVFGQGGMGDELLTASGSSRHNIAVGRQYHEDAQGTIEATTAIAGAAGGTVGSGGSGSAASGSVQSAFAVDAWGNQLSASLGTGQDVKSVEDNPFLFLGGLGYWQEPELELSYVRARWLDTNNGQWMSVDPVDGEPRYNYAYNSPTLRVDPSGQFASPFDLSFDTLGILLPAQVRKEFTKIQHRLQREGNHAISIANHALQSLRDLYQHSIAQWEHARASLPAFLANMAPPSPLDVPGSLMWQIGMIAGAFQALLNLIPILPFIPDFIAFIQYMVKHTKGLAGIIPTIGEYIKEQWGHIVALFTQHQDMSPFQRGLLFGNLLVSVIIAIIGVILAFVSVNLFL